MFIYYLLACIFCAVASAAHQRLNGQPFAFPFIHLGWLGMAVYFFGLIVESHGKG